MPNANKPKTVAELSHIPAKENLAKIPVWLGSSYHWVQPTTIVAKQPSMGRRNMEPLNSLQIVGTCIRACGYGTRYSALSEPRLLTNPDRAHRPSRVSAEILTNHWQATTRTKAARQGLQTDLPQNRPCFGRRIRRFGDGPSDHDVARSRCDRLGGSDHSNLVAHVS